MRYGDNGAHTVWYNKEDRREMAPTGEKHPKSLALGERVRVKCVLVRSEGMDNRILWVREGIPETEGVVVDRGIKWSGEYIPARRGGYDGEYDPPEFARTRFHRVVLVYIGLGRPVYVLTDDLVRRRT